MEPEGGVIMWWKLYVMLWLRLCCLSTEQQTYYPDYQRYQTFRLCHSLWAVVMDSNLTLKVVIGAWYLEKAAVAVLTFHLWMCRNVACLWYKCTHTYTCAHVFIGRCVNVLLGKEEEKKRRLFLVISLWFTWLPETHPEYWSSVVNNTR